MAETDPRSETPTVVGDTWSGLPHYTCGLCGWDSMDVDRLTEHLRFEHPSPVGAPLEDAGDQLLLDPDEANGEHARVAEEQADPAAPAADPLAPSEEPAP